MRRKYTADEALEAIGRIRSHIKNVMFTTDIIVGFPGETEHDFELTRQFVKRAGFLMTHVFPYSSRKGTPAADFPGKVSQEEKHRRASILSSDASEVRESVLKDYISQNKTAKVLFETDEKGISAGHTDNFINVAVESNRPLHGMELTVEFTGIGEGGCFARIVPEPHH